MFSTKLVEAALLDRHDEVSCLYIAAMWDGRGDAQGLMWRAVNPDGTRHLLVHRVRGAYLPLSTTCG